MNKHLRIATVVGARPQFVKAAVVSRAITEHNRDNPETSISESIIHTGQHYDANMSDVFFDEMSIPKPNHALGIAGSSHGATTGRMLEGIEEILLANKFDFLLVYGDTNSTLAGALAAVKLHIPVVHVEAGLRSFDPKMPEEVNRVLTDHCSSILLTPTQTAVTNLRNEGLPSEKIINVGDVMYDAVKFYRGEAEQQSSILKTNNLTPREYVLATVHRAQNTDDHQRLGRIMRGLIKVAQQKRVVLPIHPRTRKALSNAGLIEDVKKHLQLIDPVGYFDMLSLEMNASLIATDSGGVQKEAFFVQVPCMIFREETEWVELVEIGASTLVSADEELIAKVASNSTGRVESNETIFGDGDAGSAIVKALCELKAVSKSNDKCAQAPALTQPVR